MKKLADYKDDIHSCSKCGLCQAVCPIYKITGNDCTVSRGHFIMLRGILDGKLKMTEKMNYYLDLCLKCSACSKFCPSGIDVVDIISLAKAEYLKLHPIKKFFLRWKKRFVFNICARALTIFSSSSKSLKYDKKVLYFSGCGGKGTDSVIKILNSAGIEVLIPKFDCCGIPFFVDGDVESFEKYMKSFFSVLEETGVKEVVTTCATCEKTLKSYSKWSGKSDYSVKNIYEYICENNLKLELKNKTKVTFHKPCNSSNIEYIEQILKNTKNLEYVQMEDFDKCCGFNGLLKFNSYGIMLNLFKDKRNKILNSGAKIVLTSCLACSIALRLFSFGKYSVKDFSDFIAANLK